MSGERLILLAAAGSLALLIGAWTFQALGYAPCKLCLWQRWPHMAAVAIGAAALVVPGPGPGPVLASLGAAATATSGGLGLYHSGVERGWWAGPTSCTGDGSLAGLSGADLLATDAGAAVVMCDEVAWQMAGLSMASWNAILSFALAGLWIAAARRA